MFAEAFYATATLYSVLYGLHTLYRWGRRPQAVSRTAYRISWIRDCDVRPADTEAGYMRVCTTLRLFSGKQETTVRLSTFAMMSALNKDTGTARIHLVSLSFDELTVAFDRYVTVNTLDDGFCYDSLKALLGTCVYKVLTSWTNEVGYDALRKYIDDANGLTRRAQLKRLVEEAP